MLCLSTLCFLAGSIVPARYTMSQNLSLVAWLGQTRHPPRSLLRSILVLVDLQDLRPFVTEALHSSAMEYTTRTRVPWFFFQKDERCFFTYAQYVEPLASTAVTIQDLQHAIVLRILQTWGLRFRSSMLKLYITDRQDREHLLQGEDSLYQILGAYHPLWFCGHLPRGFERPRVSPFCPYVLRLSCSA